MASSVDDLPWLLPGDPFPPAEAALLEPDGLLALGGDLSPSTLLRAYRAGIFPWFSEDQPVLWWSPDPRLVLFPGEFHLSRRLWRTLRRGPFRFSFNRDFAGVIRGCAGPRAKEPGTWITPSMQQAYERLHALGHAHSVEVWREDSLVGGLYGIRLGAVFCGESMFSRESDASKCALALLCGLHQSLGLALIDAQISSDHLLRLGAREIPRRQFLALLAEHAGRAEPPLPGGPPAGFAEYRRDFTLEDR